MSAFIVSATHINALVTYAVEQQVSYWNHAAGDRVRITDLNAEEVGRILMDENVRSVCARYSDSDNDTKNAAADYVYKHFPTPLTAIEAIKGCCCLEYQSCETDDWEASLAWRILQEIKSSAVHLLPGWEKAPWGIDSSKGLQHAGVVSLTSLMRRR